MLLRTGLGSGLLTAIHSSTLLPIRDHAPEKFGLLAVVEIGRCATEYCGADMESSGPAIKESATMLREKFSGLSLDEVRQAFMLAASRQIDANLSAFYGQFTVNLFGQVMSAYVEFRRPVFADMLKAIDEQKAADIEAEKESRNAKTRDEIINQFHSMCEGWEPMFATPDQVPAIWPKILIEEKLVFGDPATWIDAKKVVVERFKFAQSIFLPDETLSAFDAKRVYLALQNEPDIFPADLRPRAEGVYGRMLVYQEILKRSNQ